MIAGKALAETLTPSHLAFGKLCPLALNNSPLGASQMTGSE